MTADEIRPVLERILHKTKGATASHGFWVGDGAGERRAMDNLRAGRLHWRQAYITADAGLSALERGDLDYAELALREAQGLYAAALESQVESAALANLNRDAGLRGAPEKAERDDRLAERYLTHLQAGLSAAHARQKAVEDDEELRSAFRDIGDAGIRAAVRRGLRRKGVTET